MKCIQTELPGVLILEPKVFEDSRGYFYESYHQANYAEFGIRDSFVQDNHSYSVQGILRGLHYQLHHPQAKLCRVIRGEVFDIAVDIRRGSPTFGKWTSVILSEENKKQIYIPKSFAHGFCVLSETAQFLYKCSDFYFSDDEHGIIWNDSDLKINWPVTPPLLSKKDSQFLKLKEINPNFLPIYQEK
jgi:dTDP-4-dehydrorhamnose 3,5-epimerase